MSVLIVACIVCRKHFENSENCRRHVGICEKLRGVDLQALYDSGLSVSEIAAQVGLSPDQIFPRLAAHRGRGKAGVVHSLYDDPAPCVYCGRMFRSKGNRRRHESYCAKTSGVDLQKEYDSGLSLPQIAEKFGVTRKFLEGIVQNRRSRHEGTELRKKKEPEKFFYGGTKMGKPSRGEEVFATMLKDCGLTSKYEVVSQYHLYGYRLDFAFTKLKIDVEIDGMQHYTNEVIKKRDEERDAKLIASGWSVYRIVSVDFLRRPRVVFERFVSRLKNSITQPIRLVYDGQIIDGYVKFSTERENLIRKSGIDFKSKGWTLRLGELLKVHSNTARRWVESNMPEFYRDECRTPRAHS